MRLIQIKSQNQRDGDLFRQDPIPHGRSQTMTVPSKVAWMIECRQQ